MAGKVKPEPWERQENETAKQFEAFALYRDMGDERTQKKVGEQLGKSGTLISRWAGLNKWTERCAAWDAEKDRLLRIEQLKDIKQMRKRHADLASAMLFKSAKALKNIPIDDIRASDISRMVNIASKLERISRGDVGDVIEERHSEEAISPVQIYLPDNHRDDMEPDE